MTKSLQGLRELLIFIEFEEHYQKKEDHVIKNQFESQSTVCEHLRK